MIDTNKMKDIKIKSNYEKINYDVEVQDQYVEIILSHKKNNVFCDTMIDNLGEEYIKYWFSKNTINGVKDYFEVNISEKFLSKYKLSPFFYIQKDKYQTHLLFKAGEKNER